MLDQKDFSFHIKAVNEDGLFSGYASVFNLVDGDQDIVVKGAFNASLADWSAKGRLPALLWQHRMGEPIGVYTKMHEDDVGLYVEGKLALKTARGAEAYELMKMNAVSGLSIGFVSRDDSYDRVTGVRTIKQVDLWEVSVVTFPANDASRVNGVKAAEARQANEAKALQNLINIIRGASQ
ncbi:HK97 family phage prohead protease [Chromobacterium sp. S0633]|uniref:HK97 family phage prohead protease n=1 Tax=Chromobacterium sp. S0633 TaxID=2957805 RepID=UPI00209E3F28|nr:HK97 family phage prohead protease [Chromobacterium sp. S0633]MCP1289830.1 HK97 family phage prohead protease [Chromobacterium sp. S0633]